MIYSFVLKRHFCRLDRLFVLAARNYKFLCFVELLFGFNFSNACFLLFWGFPSLRSGRAVSQLAVRSALRGFQPLGLPPLAALLSIPKPAAASPPVKP
ncbi:hypothetical protein PPO43_01255 [Saprospira sp. CCB-QB6]|uniref:hypothetical protein n=1 Tax=Saprospira sp. CCB-QB6 TaxID=3023936 RepID=UPI00234A2AB8|nr:hypothetical protein [Saprospira sp. CCB-QB6]WCL81722.1 hypothetical protein PPO43_01255 [Saprospira sp. CCB-QB6]